MPAILERLHVVGSVIKNQNLSIVGSSDVTSFFTEIKKMKVLNRSPMEILLWVDWWLIVVWTLINSTKARGIHYDTLLHYCQRSGVECLITPTATIQLDCILRRERQVSWGFWKPIPVGQDIFEEHPDLWKLQFASWCTLKYFQKAREFIHNVMVKKAVSLIKCTLLLLKLRQHRVLQVHLVAGRQLSTPKKALTPSKRMVFPLQHRTHTHNKRGCGHRFWDPNASCSAIGGWFVEAASDVEVGCYGRTVDCWHASLQLMQSLSSSPMNLWISYPTAWGPWRLFPFSR